MGGTSRILLNRKVFLIKTDAFGDTLWTRTYLDSVSYLGNEVGQTSDGGYIIAGSGNADCNIYLVKTDSNGDTAWTRSFNTAGGASAHSAQQTNDGGFIIAGQAAGFGAGSDDVLLIKTDSSGDTLWTRAYGGAFDDLGKSVRQTSDGGYIVAGNTASFSAAQSDFYLLKIDSTGGLMWSKTYTDPHNKFLSSVEQVYDSGLILMGMSDSGSVYLLKTDSTGILTWAQNFDLSNPSTGCAVKQTKDQGLIIAGFCTGADQVSDSYIAKTSSSGFIEWTATFDGGNYYNDSSVSNAVWHTSDEGYVVSGYLSGSTADSSGIYLIKTDSLGNSNCNQSTLQVNYYGMNIQDSNPPTIVSPANFIMGHPYMAIEHMDTVVTLCLTVEIRDYSEGHNTVSVFPNPAGSRFTVRDSQFAIESISIFNLIGEQVGNEQFASGKKEFTLDVSTWNKGIYLVRVRRDCYNCREGVVVKKLVVD